MSGPPCPCGLEHAPAALSARERELLRHLAAGLTYAQAARRMHLSVHTVDWYVRRIKDRCALRTRAELLRLALALDARASGAGTGAPVGGTASRG